MSTDANKATVRRFVAELINSGNLDLTERFIGPAYLGHYPGVPLVEGSKGWRQAATTYLTAFPDLWVDLADLVAEDDRVVGRFTCRATHRGPLLGIPSSGRPVFYASLVILRLAEGKIVEEWHQDNLMTVMQQVGAITAPSAH